MMKAVHKALHQSTLRNLIVGTVALVLVTPSLTAQESKFALPASEEGLPGEGMLRRYDGYVKTWARLREQWSKQIAQDQGAVAVSYTHLTLPTILLV